MVYFTRVTAVFLLCDPLCIIYLCYDLSTSSIQYMSTCVGVLQLACVLICIHLGGSLWRCGWRCLSISMQTRDLWRTLVYACAGKVWGCGSGIECLHSKCQVPGLQLWFCERQQQPQYLIRAARKAMLGIGHCELPVSTSLGASSSTTDHQPRRGTPTRSSVK